MTSYFIKNLLSYTEIRVVTVYMYILHVRWFSLCHHEGGGGGTEDEIVSRVLLTGLISPSGRSRGRPEGLLGVKEGVVRLSQTTGGTREKKIAIQY